MTLREILLQHMDSWIGIVLAIIGFVVSSRIRIRGLRGDEREKQNKIKKSILTTSFVILCLALLQLANPRRW